MKLEPTEIKLTGERSIDENGFDNWGGLYTGKRITIEGYEGVLKITGITDRGILVLPDEAE